MKFAIEDLESSAFLISAEAFTKGKRLTSANVKKSLDISVSNRLFSGIRSESPMRRIREFRRETYNNLINNIFL